MTEKNNNSSTKSTFLVVLLIIAALAIGYLFSEVQNLKKGSGSTAQADNGQAQQAEQQAPTPVPVELSDIQGLFTKDNISFGDKNKKVLFVEISDPSCPYCHIAGGSNPELASEAGAQFKYVSDGGEYMPPVAEMKKLVQSGDAGYVYLFANGHGNGLLASQALYCANDQGKFWEAHEKLMSNEGYDLINNVVKNDKEQIGKLVELLGTDIDGAQITTCLEDEKYAKKLDEDQAKALTLGFQGTPHFFVNNTAYGGAQSYSAMESEVNEALTN